MPERNRFEERIAVIVVVWIVLGGIGTIETISADIRLVLFFAPALVLLATAILSRD